MWEKWIFHFYQSYSIQYIIRSISNPIKYSVVGESWMNTKERQKIKKNKNDKKNLWTLSDMIWKWNEMTAILFRYMWKFEEKLINNNKRFSWWRPRGIEYRRRQRRRRQWAVLVVERKDRWGEHILTNRPWSSLGIIVRAHCHTLCVVPMYIVIIHTSCIYTSRSMTFSPMTVWPHGVVFGGWNWI